MTVEEWDPRSPVERLRSLTGEQQKAFKALFHGGMCELQGAWCAKRGEHISWFFGKAECEWPDIALWKYILPGLRLTNWEEGPRRPALGMHPGSVVYNVTITVTDDGRQAYHDLWKKD